MLEQFIMLEGLVFPPVERMKGLFQPIKCKSCVLYVTAKRFHKMNVLMFCTSHDEADWSTREQYEK